MASIEGRNQIQISRLKKHISSIGVGDVPIVVVFIASACGWVAIEYGGIPGGGIVRDTTAYASPTLYIVSLVLHRSLSSYVASMYFFIPAGIALTYLTNNRNVLGVVVISHVATVMISGLAWGIEFTGTTGVAYGVLAATVVRATKVGFEKYSEKTQQAGPIAIHFVGSLGLLMLVTTAEGGFQYGPILLGFVFGGSYEAARVYLEIRRARRVRQEKDKKEDESSFGFTHEEER